MTEKQPYPVQPASFSTGPSQYYQADMPTQPVINRNFNPRLSSSPQHMSNKFKIYFSNFKYAH